MRPSSVKVAQAWAETYNKFAPSKDKPIARALASVLRRAARECSDQYTPQAFALKILAIADDIESLPHHKNGSQANHKTEQQEVSEGCDR